MHQGNQELIVLYKANGFSLETEATAHKAFYFDKSLQEAFLAAPYRALLSFGFSEKRDEMSVSLRFLHSIAAKFILHLSKQSGDLPDQSGNRTAMVDDKALAQSNEEFLEILHSVPFVTGIEHINFRWVKDVWQALAAELDRELLEFSGSREDFMRAKKPDINIFGKVFFHLVENKSADYPFAFLATYSAGRSDDKKAAHLPLKSALLEYRGQDDQLLKLLSTVSRAADHSDFISELVESGELFSPLQFTSDDAYTFLTEIPLYEESGILCRIPDWWRKKSNSLRLSITVGRQPPSQVGMDSLLHFEPDLFLGDEPITKEELERLLNQTAGLSYLKGKWVEVDRSRLQATLEAYEKATSLAEEGALSLAQAMRMELQPEDTFGTLDGESVAEITSGQWLSSLKSRLLNPAEIETLFPGEEFKATLRHYQQSGFGWLAFMKNLGFGALLADDMGLGKTVQILALLEHLRVTAPGHQTLLILPASLIGNWQKEIDRFAPQLRYKVLHSKTKSNSDALLDGSDLYITTYGMVVRMGELKETHWSMVILDEAQAIKNPAAKQTQAVKRLPTSARIAMTGTPIENRLSDLWSLFDFLNSGLLGSAKEFTGLTKCLQDKGDYSRLRAVVNPFILRRLKTDKAVISDLPDKMEVKTYAGLSKKQVVLYKGLVNEMAERLRSTEGISRKGMVLAGIMKFKQICNHPDQYLGQEAFDAKQSGKFSLLAEICETIREKHERVLVFTQFREMTGPLSDYLETVFDRKGLVLHGGTPVKKRGELVEKFCGEEYVPFMVLSLKAGGVGLNLTAANHVIHFDRWWNPAVENQATDRAFRIGQQKNVMVHKFVTTGTIEEKIDLMIEGKQQLAGDIIEKSGENWITEMDNDTLIRLFTLEV